ncbi:hypothetical protein V6Z11_D09G010100 [Gossypium hirsutum]
MKNSSVITVRYSFVRLSVQYLAAIPNSMLVVCFFFILACT